MANITVVLGITAALLHGIAYFLYNVQAKRGSSVPVSASWFIWAFLSVLNAFSYREMSDFVVALQSITGAAACFLTFCYMLFIKKLAWPRGMEWVMLSFGLLASLVWWQFRSATGANMIVLTALVISFIPVYGKVLLDPFKETPLSWTLWSLAFFVTVVNVILRHGKPVTFLTPIVMLIAHAGIALLSRESRKQEFERRL